MSISPIAPANPGGSFDHFDYYYPEHIGHKKRALAIVDLVARAVCYCPELRWDSGFSSTILKLPVTKLMVNPTPSRVVNIGPNEEF